jgi:large subunit ribosomal protein L22
LVVQEATVGEGPTFKRFQPKARGSAGPIRKRTSHIRIILSDEIALPEPVSRKSSTKKRTVKSKTTKGSRKKETATAGAKGSETKATGEETVKPGNEYSLWVKKLIRSDIVWR